MTDQMHANGHFTKVFLVQYLNDKKFNLITFLQKAPLLISYLPAGLSSDNLQNMVLRQIILW